MVLLDFSMFPLGQRGKSQPLRRPKPRHHRPQRPRLPLPRDGHHSGGRIGEALAVVRQCFEAMAADCDRIECSIKIDYRKAAAGRLDGKVASVERKLGRSVKK